MAITQELQQVLKSVRCSKQDLLFFQISLDFIGLNGGVSLPPHSERSQFCSGSQITPALKFKFTFFKFVFRKIEIRLSTFSRTLQQIVYLAVSKFQVSYSNCEWRGANELSWDMFSRGDARLHPPKVVLQVQGSLLSNCKHLFC